MIHASHDNSTRAWRQGRILLVAMVALQAAVAPSWAGTPVDLSDPDVAVDSGARALSHGPKPPWYDAKTDGFRPAQVKPPRQPTQFNPQLAELLLRLGWVLLAGLLIYLVYLIVRTFLNEEVAESLPIERGVAAGDISRVEELPVALAKSPADYLAEAERLYRRGDYAQAIVYLFSHQLLQLDRRHLVRLVKGKTNRQYLREARRSADSAAEPLANMFESTVLVFEEIFFGKRLPPQEQIDAVWANVEPFEQLVATAEERAA